MRTIGIFLASRTLPMLLKEVEEGDVVCITNGGREIAFIVPAEKKK